MKYNLANPEFKSGLATCYLFNHLCLGFICFHQSNGDSDKKLQSVDKRIKFKKKMYVNITSYTHTKQIQTKRGLRQSEMGIRVWIPTHSTSILYLFALNSQLSFNDRKHFSFNTSKSWSSTSSSSQ